MDALTLHTMTASGRRFYPHTPSSGDVYLEDIATALSKQCRFNGHCKGFYSVAQHSVLVSHLCPPMMAKWGLLHDASEAYVGDLVQPIKVALPDYKAIENGVMKVVAAHFGLEMPEPLAVKWADNRALATEKRDLMGDTDFSEFEGVPPAEEVIIPMEWREAKALFLARCKELEIT